MTPRTTRERQPTGLYRHPQAAASAIQVDRSPQRRGIARWELGHTVLPIPSGRRAATRLAPPSMMLAVAALRASTSFAGWQAPGSSFAQPGQRSSLAQTTTAGSARRQSGQRTQSRSGITSPPTRAAALDRRRSTPQARARRQQLASQRDPSDPSPNELGLWHLRSQRDDTDQTRRPACDRRLAPLL